MRLCVQAAGFLRRGLPTRERTMWSWPCLAKAEHARNEARHGCGAGDGAGNTDRVEAADLTQLGIARELTQQGLGGRVLEHDRARGSSETPAARLALSAILGPPLGPQQTVDEATQPVSLVEDRWRHLDSTRLSLATQKGPCVCQLKDHFSRPRCRRACGSVR